MGQRGPHPLKMGLSLTAGRSPPNPFPFSLVLASHIVRCGHRLCSELRPMKCRPSLCMEGLCYSRCPALHGAEVHTLKGQSGLLPPLLHLLCSMLQGWAQGPNGELGGWSPSPDLLHWIVSWTFAHLAPLPPSLGDLCSGRVVLELSIKVSCVLQAKPGQ